MPPPTQPNGCFETHQDDHGLTPLALALITGSHEAAARLASLGADVSAADTQGVAPAHRAAGHGDLSALELLKGSGADFETQSGAGTPLHWAAGEVRNAVYLSINKNWWMGERVPGGNRQNNRHDADTMEEHCSVVAYLENEQVALGGAGRGCEEDGTREFCAALPTASSTGVRNWLTQLCVEALRPRERRT